MVESEIEYIYIFTLIGKYEIVQIFIAKMKRNNFIQSFISSSNRFEKFIQIFTKPDILKES